MKPVSVKELHALLDKAIKEGKGDCIVRVSDDDECNDTHALWEKNYREGDDFQYWNEKDKRWYYSNTIVIQ
jgi:hypothetical protein